MTYLEILDLDLESLAHLLLGLSMLLLSPQFISQPAAEQSVLIDYTY